MSNIEDMMSFTSFYTDITRDVEDVFFKLQLVGADEIAKVLELL